MSNKFGNITPNKISNYNNNSLATTPKFSQLLPLKENINSKLKLFNSMKNNLFSNTKINFNSFSNNKNNSGGFLIPFSKTFIQKANTEQKRNDFTYKKISIPNKKILFSDIKTLTKNFDLNDSFCEIKPQNIFLNKKRKLMTTEELELEKMNKEKEAIKKLMQKNKKFYLKSFNYSPMKINPSPLTTFIPFKLSSNNNTKYIRQGKGNTIYEVNKQNQKIRLKMQQKIEKLTDNKTKDGILLNNVDYLKKQNELYKDLFNNENNNNNSLLNNNDENKNLNINEINSKSTKEFSIYKRSQTQILDSQIKKLKDNNKILDYLRSLRKNKTND